MNDFIGDRKAAQITHSSPVWSFSIIQDDMTVAGGTTRDETSAASEAAHYSMQYGQDGPCNVKIAPMRDCEKCGRSEVITADDMCWGCEFPDEIDDN